MNIKYFFLCISIFLTTINALPDEGRWNYNLTTHNGSIYLSKSLYKNSEVFIQINCDSKIPESKVGINLAIVQSACWDITEAYAIIQKELQATSGFSNTPKIYHENEIYQCNDNIFIRQSEPSSDNSLERISSENPIHTILHDGVYVLGLVTNINSTDSSIGVQIKMKSDYGYLSAADWPLLPFYGFMCIYYVILGLIWLFLSFLQWRDLLRVQFWIGGVILLGMLEKATFYAEYQSINNTGVRVQGAMIVAEWVSCAKRTLARMLVVIVSLGFGIVKPRLGATLHRVVGVGLLYLFLAASEAYLRITRAKNDPSRDILVASVPLAVLDSAICWWIFSALVNTTRTLRLRRNETKLNLYRHFTNTLIFSVAASVFFMLYCIKVHHFVDCLVVWKDIWIEEAYWHILFSLLLLVIMILWRPTNNNQRYAFVPLLDTGDDEEEEQLVNDAYGVKVRVHHVRNSTPPRVTIEDDIKWLEENVKNDPALPILDSDEELVSTRFEVSKMQ
ncbi:transmembrane protein 87A [Leptinotarsa decemlineata]|uniref:transmembrane protein 87A n=1 Tax=Leptinotarsa decemlineata TaxID=7539 RepID=UPI000C2548F6|nr:transmembrane protein 87A [Leptinotarsa decemlineata]